MRLTLTFILSLFIFFSCKKEANKPQQYLFLGHIYQWGVEDNNRIDFRFKGFDFKAWDQIWLGGDLCPRTTEYPETIDYLDSIFDLSSAQTHWALGNHDTNHGNLNWIKNKTQRNSFYSTYLNGICLIVLNTTEFHHPNYKPSKSECTLLDNQLLMLQNIADTINNASHCVILHHNALLSNQMVDDSIDIGKIFNVYRSGLKVSCRQSDTFEKVLFPVLKKIQKKGVQVILVGGDLGQRVKEFEYQTSEGIWFLGSGINNSALAPNMPAYVTNTSSDKVLIFSHQVKMKKLSWEFIELKELLKE